MKVAAFQTWALALRVFLRWRLSLLRRRLRWRKSVQLKAPPIVISLTNIAQDLQKPVGTFCRGIYPPSISVTSVSHCLSFDVERHLGF